MDTISPIDKNLSWKDCLLRNGPRAGERTETINNVKGEEDFELLESDIVRSSINGIPSIHFSERVNQLLIKDMARTVVIKLLGRNIGYSALYNTSTYGSWMLVERQGRCLARVVKVDDSEGIGASGNSIPLSGTRLTKPAEKMSPSRGKSERSTKGGLEMNPKDGEGPNEILARVVTITPTEGIFDPSRHSAVVVKENNRPGFLASAPE
ncbi:hypothetical protein Gorai_016411, partial [Gossypium raimondii]|nr:hypothetical protein [Gossypium raimondii]